MPTEIQRLEEKLEELKKENSDAKRVKQLKVHIRTQKFLGTKTGKFVDKVGGFGSAVGKKIFAPKPQVKGKKKKVPSIKEIMDRLPQ